MVPDKLAVIGCWNRAQIISGCLVLTGKRGHRNFKHDPLQKSYQGETQVLFTVTTHMTLRLKRDLEEKRRSWTNCYSRKNEKGILPGSRWSMRSYALTYSRFKRWSLWSSQVLTSSSTVPTAIWIRCRSVNMFYTPSRQLRSSSDTRLLRIPS